MIYIDEKGTLSNYAAVNMLKPDSWRRWAFLANYAIKDSEKEWGLDFKAGGCICCREWSTESEAVRWVEYGIVPRHLLYNPYHYIPHCPFKKT